MANLFRAKVVDVGARSLVLEITGEEDKIDALYDLLRPFGILELMRTGRIAMVRGKSAGRVSDDVGAPPALMPLNGAAAAPRPRPPRRPRTLRRSLTVNQPPPGRRHTAARRPDCAGPFSPDHFSKDDLAWQ